MTVIAKAAGKRFEVTKDGKHIGFHKTMEAACEAVRAMDLTWTPRVTRYPAMPVTYNNRRD